jgi:uncharacterized membrane protein
MDIPAPWLELFGRLHPMLVHFPIALLLIASFFEFARRRSHERRPAAAALWCLGIGAVSAVVAAAAGWARAAVEPIGGDDAQIVLQHRWGGVAVASIAVLALLFGGIGCSRMAWARVPYRAGLLGLLLLVPAVGHLGGTLVFGRDYFTEPFTRDQAPQSQVPSAQTAPAAPTAPVATAAIDYATQVAPILEASCVECHGPKKKKAGLALEPIAGAFKGDPSEWAIRPGDAAASPLIQRVELPRDDDDAMPPGEREPLSAQQIAVLRAWIDAGAPRPDASASESQTDVAKSSVEAVAPSAAALAQRDAVIATVVAGGAFAAPIAQDSTDVEVNLGLLGAQCGDAQLAQLAGLEPFVVALHLSRTSVTDGAASALATLTRLERLWLDHTGVGDGIVPVLKLMPQLEYLNLVGTKVSNAAIPVLGDLPQLKKLYVWNSAMTAEGVAALRQARPQLEVVFDEMPATSTEPAASAPEAPAGEAPSTPPAATKHAPCCDKAKAAGMVCDHPCCVAAAKEGKLCETCAVDGP